MGCLAALLAAGSGLCGDLAAGEWDRDADRDHRVKLYFAVPLGARDDRARPRLGLQYDNDQLARIGGFNGEPRSGPAVDLGLSADGIAKFDLLGADMKAAMVAIDQHYRLIGPGSSFTATLLLLGVPAAAVAIYCASRDCLGLAKDRAKQSVDIIAQQTTTNQLSHAEDRLIAEADSLAMNDVMRDLSLGGQ